MSVALALVATAGCIASVGPPGILVRFDNHALLGPVDQRAVLYPSELTAPGYTVGPTAEAAFEGGTEGMVLRVEFDEATLPAAARPARVRVVRKALLAGWDPVATYLQRRADGKHAAYAPLDEPGHYALVVSATEPPAFNPLLRKALGAHIAWIVRKGGKPLAAALAAKLTPLSERLGGSLGGLRLLRSHAGPRAERVRMGLLDFFRLTTGQREAVVVKDTVYVTRGPLLDPAAADVDVRLSLARIGAEVLAQRAGGDPWIDRWVALLARHGWVEHPMHAAVRKHALEALSD